MVNVTREPWGYDGAIENILHSLLEVIVAKPSWYHLPKSNNQNYGREKTHIVIVLLTTTFMTLCRFLTKKSPNLYKDVKYRNIFLKTRKLHNRHKMLLTLPKILFLTFYFLTSGQSPKNKPRFSHIYKQMGPNNFFL